MPFTDARDLPRYDRPGSPPIRADRARREAALAKANLASAIATDPDGDHTALHGLEQAWRVLATWAASTEGQPSAFGAGDNPRTFPDSIVAHARRNAGDAGFDPNAGVT